VARGTGIATSTINFLYWDKVKKVDYATLEKLCEFLDCQPGDLLIYKKGK
jgi:putative transcriptional regulator